MGSGDTQRKMKTEDLNNYMLLPKEERTISRIGKGPDGHIFVIYLKDGFRIRVGRSKETSGAAWIELEETPIIKVQS